MLKTRYTSVTRLQPSKTVLYFSNMYQILCLYYCCQLFTYYMKLRHLRMLIACNIVHRSMHRLFHIVLLVKQDPVSLYQTG